MSNSGRIVLVMAMVATMAACAKKEAPVEPVEPVTVEPTYTGKYK
jgi:hypothetical protein